VESTSGTPLHDGLIGAVAVTDPGPATPLRIALVCPYSLSRPGGVQGQVLGLARSLGARSHAVSVFAPVDGTGAEPEGIEVFATGSSVSLPANGAVAPVTLSVRAVTRGLRAVRAGGFDVVHVHEPFTPGLPYGLLVGRHLPPLVATFHRSGGSPFYTMLRPVTRRLAQRFAVRCAVSDAARATASAALGGEYEVLFNGVEIDRFHGVEPWPTERPTVLFLGRHEPRKGLQVLLDAFDRLGTGDPGGPAPVAPPILWIAGDGPQTGSLRRLHPESSSIRWLGVLSDEEKIRRLTGAHVLCAPSLGGESFGMVLVEAMAARTTVVASDIDGYRQAAGGHAVLVPPGDTRSLAGALTGALTGTLVPPVPGGPTAPAEGGPRPAGGDRTDPDGAFAWASHWSMDRLAGCYEGLYRAAMVGTPP
jgi:phosphatidyl-myo-inositol alpha-mannosyltransferase